LPSPSWNFRLPGISIHDNLSHQIRLLSDVLMLVCCNLNRKFIIRETRYRSVTVINLTHSLWCFKYYHQSLSMGRSSGAKALRIGCKKGRVMIEIDMKTRSKGIIETLRERIAELEDLEAMGAATPDTCETLVDLYELLDKLDRKISERVGKNLH